MVTLLHHLDRSRFEPFLYLVYRDGPLLEQVPDDVPVVSFDERVASRRFALPGMAHRRRVADLAAWLKEVDADVSYDRTFLMTLISAAAAQRVGVPNISTIVTNPERGFAPVAGRFPRVKRRLLGQLYRRSAGVVAVSAGVRDAAIRFYGIPPERVCVIPNGVDGDAIRTAAGSGAVGDAWWDDCPPGTVHLVSAGRLNHEKGFHLLIAAMDELRRGLPSRNWRVAILGEGRGRAELQRQVDAAGLSDCVRLPGFRTDAAAWYRSADLFVLPSLVEGMPNVLLEAMAVGTPIVAADCDSGPAEILGGGEFGELVAVDDVAALVTGIRRVVDDEASALRKAEAAAALVETERSVTTSTRRIATLLERAAGTARRRPSATRRTDE